MAERTIADVGRFLQRYGLNIGEHPQFGGVGKGHSPTGYHPTGEAIDVRDWRPDMAPAYIGGQPKDWKTRTGELRWRANQLGLFNEVLGPGDPGHDTHVHLALKGKKFLTDPQLEWLATGRTTVDGKRTDVMPGATAPIVPTTTDSNATNVNDILNAVALGMGLATQRQPTAQETIQQKLLGELIRPRDSIAKQFLNAYLAEGLG